MGLYDAGDQEAVRFFVNLVDQIGNSRNDFKESLRRLLAYREGFLATVGWQEGEVAVLQRTFYGDAPEGWAHRPYLRVGCVGTIRAVEWNHYGDKPGHVLLFWSPDWVSWIPHNSDAEVLSADSGRPNLFGLKPEDLVKIDPANAPDRSVGLACLRCGWTATLQPGEMPRDGAGETWGRALCPMCYVPGEYPEPHLAVTSAPWRR